jgi:hypothetical protein
VGVRFRRAVRGVRVAAPRGAAPLPALGRGACQVPSATAVRMAVMRARARMRRAQASGRRRGSRAVQAAMRWNKGAKTESRRAIRSSPGWGGWSCATGTGLCHAHVMDETISPPSGRCKG